MIEFRRILDVSMALLVDIYRDFNMSFFEVIEELDRNILGRRPPIVQPSSPAAAEVNNAALTMLEAQLAGSTFGGGRR